MVVHEKERIAQPNCTILESWRTDWNASNLDIMNNLVLIITDLTSTLNVLDLTRRDYSQP